MQFFYREIEPGKFGPVVDIRLKGPTRFFHFEAFVDSGADFSIFDIHSAQIIGLHYQDGEKIPVTVGDGDRIVVYRHQLPVWFAGSRFIAPVCFSPDLGSGFNLMGRAGFFERFRICFHEHAKLISVKKVVSQGSSNRILCSRVL